MPRVNGHLKQVKTKRGTYKCVTVSPYLRKKKKKK